jgi:hypothetical protein
MVYYQHSTLLWNSFKNYVRIIKQFNEKTTKLTRIPTLTTWKLTKGLCINAYIDHSDARCYKSPCGPMLVHDFGHGAYASSAKHNVISTCTNNLAMCVPIIETHWTIYMVKECMATFEFGENNSKNSSMPSIQQHGHPNKAPP